MTENSSINPEYIKEVKWYNETDIGSIKKAFKVELVEPLAKCCMFGKCTPCCNDNECRSEVGYPLLLIHGHSFLKSSPTESQINSFNKIESQLIQEKYIDAGVLNFNENVNLESTEWSKFRSPIVVKASYYYDNYFNLGKYVYVSEKNKNIDTYAIRLSEIIKTLKIKTGQEKVDVVAHSMGGLVLRRYMQIFGTDSINKIILIGTPNKGVEDKISTFCPIFGENLECEDMTKGSVLLAKLNDPNYTAPNINITTISGKGCDMSGKEGDGVVTLKSSQLDYAKKYVIDGVCTDLLETSLHTDLLDIDKYPEVYDIIVKELGLDIDN